MIRIAKNFATRDIFRCMIAFLCIWHIVLKASQKFHDLINEIDKSFSFPSYKISNDYRSFVLEVETSCGHLNITLNGCQSD